MPREKWRRKHQKGAAEDKQSPLTGFLEEFAGCSGDAEPGKSKGENDEES